MSFFQQSMIKYSMYLVITKVVGQSLLLLGTGTTKWQAIIWDKHGEYGSPYNYSSILAIDHEVFGCINLTSYPQAGMACSSNYTSLGSHE